MKIKSAILSLIMLAILASCSTSNNVVGGGIQKRKYNDGFYVSGGKIFDRKLDAQKTETVFVDEEIIETEKTKIGNEELGSKYEEVITSPEISTEPKIDEVNDGEKIDSDNNAIAAFTETEFEETETIETSDKVHGIYKSKKITTIVSNSLAASDSVLMLILLVILCFILPPLAVFIFEGVGTRFWIDLILWLLGWGVGYALLGGLGGLCTLVAVIFALLIVLSVI